MHLPDTLVRLGFALPLTFPENQVAARGDAVAHYRDALANPNVLAKFQGNLHVARNVVEHTKRDATVQVSSDSLNEILKKIEALEEEVKAMMSSKAGSSNDKQAAAAPSQASTGSAPNSAADEDCGPEKLLMDLGASGIKRSFSVSEHPLFRRTSKCSFDSVAGNNNGSAGKAPAPQGAAKAVAQDNANAISNMQQVASGAVKGSAKSVTPDDKEVHLGGQVFKVSAESAMGTAVTAGPESTVTVTSTRRRTVTITVTRPESAPAEPSDARANNKAAAVKDDPTSSGSSLPVGKEPTQGADSALAPVPKDSMSSSQAASTSASQAPSSTGLGSSVANSTVPTGVAPPPKSNSSLASEPKSSGSASASNSSASSAPASSAASSTAPASSAPASSAPNSSVSAPSSSASSAPASSAPNSSASAPSAPASSAPASSAPSSAASSAPASSASSSSAPIASAPSAADPVSSAKPASSAPASAPASVASSSAAKPSAALSAKAPISSAPAAKKEDAAAKEGPAAAPAAAAPKDAKPAAPESKEIVEDTRPSGFKMVPTARSKRS